MKILERLKTYNMQVGLTFIGLLVLILFMITAPGTFLKGEIYSSFLSITPFIGIAGLGLTLVLVSGEIDLSFTAVMGFAGFVFATTMSFTGSIILGILAGMAAGAMIGMLNGMLVTIIGIPSIVVTLGMQFLIRGATNIIAAGNATSLGMIRGTIAQKVLVGEIGGVIPAQSIWFLALAVLIWSLLFRHRFGDHILFSGDNPETARMMGISVTKTKILVFMLFGVLAAFSGVLDSFRLRTWWPTLGEGYLMTTMAAVFIGGTSMFGGEGTIYGTFLGAFIIGSLEAGIVATGLSGFWTRFIYGILILIAVTIHTLLRKQS
ncbi:MAG: ABC transporter permease [Candidatus Acetothermia bacterium]